MSSLSTSISGPPADELRDIQLIHLLSREVLTNFSINTELLCNWQTELSDCATKSSLLVGVVLEEVILLFPQSHIYFARSNKDALVKCLKSLDELDDSVYYDFKLLIYELLIQTTTFSYMAKIQLYRYNLLPILVNEVVKHAEATEPETYCTKSGLAAQKIRFLVAFLELGCGVKVLKAIILPLLSNSSRIKTQTKQLLLTTLYLTFNRNASHFSFYVFNSFTKKPASLALTADMHLLKCISIVTWFKVNQPAPQTRAADEIPVITLFLLANASDGNSSILKIQLVDYKQVMIEIHSVANGSRIQFAFNHIIEASPNENQGYIHLGLAYDQEKNLNLFIDGEYSESIPCSPLSEMIGQWSSICIGPVLESSEFGKVNRDELLLKDLVIFNLNLSYEWVALIFCLGIGYNWNYKEFSRENIISILNHMSHKALVKMGFKVNDIIHSNSHARLSKFKPSKQSGPFFSSTTKNSSNGTADKKTIVNVLFKSMPKMSHIRFDTSEISFLEKMENASSLRVLVHQSESIHGALYSLGGSGLLLTLIEVLTKAEYRSAQTRNEIFLQSVDLLLECLLSDWRLDKEFENNDGYDILAIILSYFKDNFNPKLIFETKTTSYFSDRESSELSIPATSAFERCHGLLQRFLVFVGCRQGNEQESLIYNSVAYRSLVLNLDFYSGTSDFCILHAHLQALISKGKFATFNVKQLSKMKLLRRLIQHIKLQILEGKMLGEEIEHLSTTLNTVICHDVSVETIRSISRFIIFTLFHTAEYGSREIGVSALQTLTDELCKPSSSIKSLKKFSRSITIHWILLLLSYPNDHTQLSKGVVCSGLQSLAKLLRVLGPHIIKRFFHGNNGLNVLTHFLKNWWDTDEVTCLLFEASFGYDVQGPMNPDISLVKLAKDDSLTAKPNKLLIPEFLLILNNMALTGMYVLSLKHGRILSVPSSPMKGSKATEFPHEEISHLSSNVLHFINQYADMIEIGNGNSIALQKFFFGKEWLEGAFELLGHLRLSLTWLSLSLVREFELSTAKFVSVLSQIFIAKLSKMKELLEMLRSLSDITTKIALDSIFPKIFEHVNEYMSSSKFIFNEKIFLDGILDLIYYHYKEFVEANFYVSTTDLETFSDCIVAVLEVASNNRTDHNSHKLGAILGRTIVIQLSQLSYCSTGTLEEEEGEEEEEEEEEGKKKKKRIEKIEKIEKDKK